MTSSRWFNILAFAVAATWSCGQALAYDGKPAPTVATEMPAELQGVGIDQKLGTKLNLEMKFTDETGKIATLGSFFDGRRPVIISPVYYSCPGLCNFHLNGFTEALKEMDWGIGDKFVYLAVSFDSKETSDLAAAKKETYLKVYGRDGAQDNWHFLTADEATVQEFTKSLGFKFRWDEQSQEWAHAAAAIVISPDGTVSRYLPGIVFSAKDIRLAINEATQGKIGTIVDSLILYCFKYDPQQSKYTLYAFNLVKMGGALTVLLMVIWLLPVWFRARRET
ncbi:MAG: SCO family protein [Bdellovibrionia bacterium]